MFIVLFLMLLATQAHGQTACCWGAGPYKPYNPNDPAVFAAYQQLTPQQQAAFDARVVCCGGPPRATVPVQIGKQKESWKVGVRIPMRWFTFRLFR